MSKIVNDKIFYLKQIFFLSGSRSITIFILIATILFSSILDILGIALIGQYFAILLDPENINNTNYIFGKLFKDEYRLLILKSGMLLIIIFLLRSIIGLLINKAILKFSWNNQVDIQTFLLKIYQKLNYEDYLNKNSS